MDIQEIILIVVFVVVLVSLTVLMFIVCLTSMKSEIEHRKLKIKELRSRIELYDFIQYYWEKKI